MPHHALDPERIHVVSWNIAKGSRCDWQEDLHHLTHNADLVLIQEATLEQAMHSCMPDCCWAFAPGFRRASCTSGVLTVARAETIKQYAHAHREPLTMLPKAALVTEYRLAGRDDTLLVANVHAINFTPGTEHFRRQLHSIVTSLAEHRGPLILSGDFNTWRGKRLRILQELCSKLELCDLVYEQDHRRQAFGFALDHIFYRGLTHKSGVISRVFSSDHNPISVTLGV